MATLLVKEEPPYSGNDVLHIANGSISAKIKIYSFKDKNTGHIVAYSPSLDISGYGDSKKEAFEMLNVSVKETFTYLVKLSHKQQAYELLKYGWKKDKLRKKD